MGQARLLFCSPRRAKTTLDSGFAQIAEGLCNDGRRDHLPGSLELLIDHGDTARDEAACDALRRHATRVRRAAGERARQRGRIQVAVTSAIAGTPEVYESVQQAARSLDDQLDLHTYFDCTGLFETVAGNDLLITTGGLSCLTAAAAGLAQIIIPRNAREDRLASELDRAGAAMKLHSGDEIAIALERALSDLVAVPAMLRLMHETALDLCEVVDCETIVAATLAFYAGSEQAAEPAPHKRIG